MLARAMRHRPSSSGWRSISRTLRGNSGSSSRNSTPLCARLTSPGRGVPEPPPDQAGVRNGVMRRAERALREQPSPVGSSPATLWTWVVSIASANVSGGRMPASASRAWSCPNPAARSSAHCGTRRRHLQRPFRHGLAAHVAEIRRPSVRGRQSGGGALGENCPAGQHATTSARCRTPKLHAFHHRGLRRIFRGHTDWVCLCRARTPPSTARRAPAGWRRRAKARPQAGAVEAPTAPMAPRMPTAIGRSNPAPSLRTLAGARLMVTVLLG